MAPLMQLSLTGIGHGCQYDLYGVQGGLLRKAYRWITNHARLLQAVTWRCPGVSASEGGHDHERVHGENTRRSGVYTDKFCWQITLFRRLD